MTSPQKTTRNTIPLVAAAILVCVGAASNAQAESSDETALRERATTYWTARVARDPKVLTYYLPPSQRAQGTVVPEGGAIHYKSFAIETVAIDGDNARLDVRIESELKGRTPFAIPDRVRKRTVSERWVRVDGVWFKQTVETALNAAGKDLRTAFERRQAKRDAAAAEVKAQAEAQANAETGAQSAEASPPGKRGSR